MPWGWHLLRIRGNSMKPALEDGDYALARNLGAGAVLSVGEIVAAEHPDYGRIVKRIAALRDGRVRLTGETAASADPDQIGWLRRELIEARLVLRISPKGMARLPPAR